VVGRARILGRQYSGSSSPIPAGAVRHRDIKPSNILLDDDDFAYRSISGSPAPPMKRE
jgi:serine/threonine protein kinase